MKKTISYSRAVDKISRMTGMDIFQKSTILAILFDTSKERTIEDVRRCIEMRMK